MPKPSMKKGLLQNAAYIQYGKDYKVLNTISCI